MREKQPRLLVRWGKYESSFDPSEPAGTCRTLKFTFSTVVISHWTLPPMRSPHWSEALPVPQVAGPDIHEHRVSSFENRDGTSVAQFSTGD